MIELSPVDFLEIQKYFVDFQKHSKSFELPPEESQCIGIYENSTLIGYFIILCYTDASMDIVQGYLKPEVRHCRLSKLCTTLLEARAKKAGIKIIRLQTMSRFKAYQPFAQNLGYKIERIVFSKELR